MNINNVCICFSLSPRHITVLIISYRYLHGLTQTVFCLCVFLGASGGGGGDSTFPAMVYGLQRNGAGKERGRASRRAHGRAGPEGRLSIRHGTQPFAAARHLPGDVQR